MPKIPWLVPAVLIGTFLLAGCGAASRSTPTGLPTSFDRPIRAAMTPAKAQRIRSAAASNGFIRQIASGSKIGVSQQVVPRVTGRRLIGGSVQVHLTPPVGVVNQRLPALIYPNEKAPPGTPTLHRQALLSGSNIGRLEVAIGLKRGNAEQIEPSGSGFEVTKFELIGPPPKNPAYAPEPGR